MAKGKQHNETLRNSIRPKRRSHDKKVLKESQSDSITSPYLFCPLVVAVDYGHRSGTNRGIYPTIMKYHDAERMTLIELRENLGPIAGSWDGESDRGEEVATTANDAYEKIRELKKLLLDLEQLS